VPRVAPAANCRIPRARLRSWLALAFVAILAPLAGATTMRPQNLADLVAFSDTIVIGTVEKVTDGFDERGIPYTEVTLRVGESLRGATSGTLRFRQFGLMRPRTVDGRLYLGVSPDGWPSWQERERVMAFLGRPAKYTGLRTTVGLAQGKLRVHDGKLANSSQNAGLFKDLRVTAPGLSPSQQAMLRGERKPVEADAFVSLVRRAVNENWIAKGTMRHAN
jgi:hypothetical protein